MSEPALTNDDKIMLLTQSGMSVDDAQAVVLGAEPTVIDEVPDEVIVPVVAPDSLPESSLLDSVFRRIIGKAYADKDKALVLCDAHAKAEFDERKLSKVQAAAAGVDRSTHNKTLWADMQKEAITLKRMVRDHYRVTSVKQKIADSKKALPQAVRDLDTDRLERLLASAEFLALLDKVE